MIGSIRWAAKAAGLFALKPTIGLVTCNGVISISYVHLNKAQAEAEGACSYRQDCLGPLGKSAWGVAALLETMLPSPASYVHFAGPPFDDNTRYKLGIVRRGFPPDDNRGSKCDCAEEAIKLFERNAILLKGGKMVDAAHIEDIETMG